MLIDTHCHLTDKRLVGQIDYVLNEAKEAGVERILMPTTGILDAKKAIEIVTKYPEVWAMAGIHPENILDSRFEISDLMNEVKQIVRSSNKVVGIGEIGLDFYWDKDKKSKKLQIEVLKGQIELAVELDLPVVIHMREAEEEMVTVLGSIVNLPRGQFHCWSGSQSMLELVLAKNFYVSFCGNITYKSAGNIREAAKKVP